MMRDSINKIKDNKQLGSYLVLTVLCLFVILQFFLQTSLSVMEKELSKDFDIDAAYISFLSSSFFYSYILLQIPSGFLLDHYGIKKVSFASLSLLGVACFIFASTTSFKIAFLTFGLLIIFLSLTFTLFKI